VKEINMSEAAKRLAEANGGHWGEHRFYSPADWRRDVESGNTRLSYWDWCLSCEEHAAVLKR
jgi:hypothetical protein